MGFTDIFKGKKNEDDQQQGQNQQPCQCGCHRGAVEVEGCEHCKPENKTDLDKQDDKGDQGGEETTGGDAPKYTHMLNPVNLQQVAPGEESKVQPAIELTQVEADEVAPILEKQSQGNWDVKHYEIVRNGQPVLIHLVDYRDGGKYPAVLEALDGE